jgi:hypothetical protein
MPEQEPISHNLFFFRLEKWPELKASLDLLAQKKEELLPGGDKVVAKIFDYLDEIFLGCKIYKDKNVFEVIDISTISFLSPVMIKEFIKDPTVQVLRDRLSVQASLVSAATLNLPEPLELYNYDEMAGILIDGNKKLYSDLNFLFTLRALLEADEPDDRVGAVFTTLSPIDPDQKEFPLYYWNEALIFSLIMQLVWKNFFLLPDNQQEFLLKNYLFSALVAGVPIEYWLRQILSSEVEGFDNDKASRAFAKAIEGNLERVPINTVTFESRKLTDILSDYIGKIYSGDIKTLVQEKFIQDIYKGQLEEKRFSDWLRNLLQLYYNLRTGEYLPK